MQRAALKLHPEDNVLIALRDLRKGEPIELSNHSFLLTSDVPAKHDFATADLVPSAAVLMYGALVGKATQLIPKGSALNTRNIRHEALPFREKATDYHWPRLMFPLARLHLPGTSSSPTLGSSRSRSPFPNSCAIEPRNDLLAARFGRVKLDSQCLLADV
jgi:hypothetical protein